MEEVTFNIEGSIHLDSLQGRKLDGAGMSMSLSLGRKRLKAHLETEPRRKETVAGKEDESTFNLAWQKPPAMFNENPFGCQRPGGLGFVL